MSNKEYPVRTLKPLNECLEAVMLAGEMFGGCSGGEDWMKLALMYQANLAAVEATNAADEHSYFLVKAINNLAERS